MRAILEAADTLRVEADDELVLRAVAAVAVTAGSEDQTEVGVLKESTGLLITSIAESPVGSGGEERPVFL